MKIIKLTAENVKRLRAVEITPDGPLQIVAGRNAQGKTSVLDAIWLALGGGAAARETVRPIRDGEDHASVTLDLGDLVVTRTWTGDKSTLTVATADGAKYSSPQAVLDSLIGRLAFDPLEFTRRSSREQMAALLDVVDLDVDLDHVAAQRQEAYELRTEVGRWIRAIGELADPVAAPDAEVSIADLLEQIHAADKLIERQNERRVLAAEAEERVSVARENLLIAEARLADQRQLVAALVPEPDVAALERQLRDAEDTNRLVRQNKTIATKAAEKAHHEAKYAELTAKIAGLDQARADALARASFPVDGLGFDESGVTYNGVPFGQASSAEQIRVSLAMAMALNPKLRVIRILDGSLLDAENLALITEMAAAQDYQVWVERVGDGDGVGVIIEDGAIA